MLLIPCVWCGPRNAAEFRYVGEVAPRPDPATATPESWREYLHQPANRRGPTLERWYHRMGCRAYVTVYRDTATNRVLAASDAGEQAGEGTS